MIDKENNGYAKVGWKSPQHQNRETPLLFNPVDHGGVEQNR